MKKIAVLNYLCVVLIIVSNYSCSNHKETKYILKQAETVMEPCFIALLSPLSATWQTISYILKLQPKPIGNSSIR